MKLVPRKSLGSSRKAYQKGYGQSASAKQKSLLGKSKLSSDVIKPAKTPGGGASVRRDYKTDASDFNVSFGNTGYTEEDYT